MLSMMETHKINSETLKIENAALCSQVKNLQNDITYLKEQIEWFRRQLFASRSEKTISSNDEQLQLAGFKELEAPEDNRRPVAAHEWKTRNKMAQISCRSLRIFRWSDIFWMFLKRESFALRLGMPSSR